MNEEVITVLKLKRQQQPRILEERELTEIGANFMQEAVYDH